MGLWRHTPTALGWQYPPPGRSGCPQSSPTVLPTKNGKTSERTAETGTCGRANNNILWKELGGGQLFQKMGGRSTKNRRSNRHISRSREDVNESQQPDSTPQRKKRKKKEPASDLSLPRNMPQKSSAGGEDSLLGSRRKLTFTSGTNGSLQSKSEEKVSQNGTSKLKKASKKKKAKKRKIKAYEGPIGLAAELNGLQEDVVLASSNGDPVEGISLSTPHMKSTPSDKLFMEYPGGFNTSKKIQVQKRRSQLATVDIEPTNQLPDSQQKTTIAFALGSHHLFMTLTLFCQGLFAGIALWHIITIQYMVNIGYDNLLAQYSQLAKPLESMYYLLFALCTVASFDRYDVHRPNRECVFLGLTVQSGGLSTVCYFVGLIFHLAATKMDDQISLSSNQADFWPDVNSRDATLKTWWILSLIRGLFAILGWAFAAISPQVDRLRATLENCEENVMAEERGYANLAFTNGV
ncbi:hypothetical protein LSAT2_031301 [Lamellibrachia satsuma]|nr:hypothetical protein LSAT2_031301 [Lamellibrachia satsuma]